jgi:hypothetical protein
MHVSYTWWNWQGVSGVDRWIYCSLKLVCINLDELRKSQVLLADKNLKVKLKEAIIIIIIWIFWNYEFHDKGTPHGPRWWSACYRLPPILLVIFFERAFQRISDSMRGTWKVPPPPLRLPWDSGFNLPMHASWWHSFDKLIVLAWDTSVLAGTGSTT